MATSTKTITGNTTVTVATSLQTFTFTITQSSNQTITVTCGGNTYTSTFTATYGQTWTASISASSGYDAGTLSATSGTVTGNVTVSATSASEAWKIGYMDVKITSISSAENGDEIYGISVSKRGEFASTISHLKTAKTLYITSNISNVNIKFSENGTIYDFKYSNLALYKTYLMPYSGNSMYSYSLSGKREGSTSTITIYSRLI